VITEAKPFERSDEYFRGRIENCAKRLIRLVQLNAPSAIVAREIWLLNKHGNAYCPDELAAVNAEQTKRDMRRAHGFCWLCDNAPQPHDSICAECDARLAAQYGTLDFDEPEPPEIQRQEGT
jgi:hypothetical protein